MQPRELERLAARCVPGVGPVDIRQLSLGLVNGTYRVERGGVAYALRLAAADGGGDLGLDCAWEARVLQSAAAAGLAPAVEYCDTRRGILLSRWIDGRCWSAAEVRTGPNLGAIAALLRRVHALPLPDLTRRMSPRGWIDYYHSALARSAARRSADDEALRAAAGARLDRLATLPAEPAVVCHSDLHTGNVLDAAGSPHSPSLILLDWEYAHASDPWWDLAGWSANNDLEDEHRHELLSQYTGRAATAGDGARLEALSWLYDYTCLLWSELYLRPPADEARPPADDARGERQIDGVEARARLLEARLKAAPE